MLGKKQEEIILRQKQKGKKEEARKATQTAIQMRREACQNLNDFAYKIGKCTSDILCDNYTTITAKSKGCCYIRGPTP